MIILMFVVVVVVVVVMAVLSNKEFGINRLQHNAS